MLFRSKQKTAYEMLLCDWSSDVALPILNEGMEGILKGIRPMRKFMKYFENKYAHLNCRDLTGTDLANPQKATAYLEAGGLEKCATMMADAAAFVAELIYDESMQS